MSNILLIEPDYRSKFPPLGLMRLSAYHKDQGDWVSFGRGTQEKLRKFDWDKIYISSLFTYELPRTVKTIKYYSKCVRNSEDIIVGGIGATLLPEYIAERIGCKVVVGPIDRKGKVGFNIPGLANYLPDYELIDNCGIDYLPQNAYFCRTSLGCIRGCNFCAVPKLEPGFSKIINWQQQIKLTNEKYGERQNLVFLDNNILALDNLPSIINKIKLMGFTKNSRFNGKSRKVDFNQGIDARLITKDVAKMLGEIPLAPVRLAFDYDAVEKAYRKAVKYMVKESGFVNFTNYLLFNFKDNPKSLYHRMRVNIELSQKYDVRLTGFPMKYVPITDVTRKYIGAHWNWKYLRGIQCVLLATHGMVSPKCEFFEAAFGRNYSEFLEILSMPDRYIIHREYYKKKGKTDIWRGLYKKLSQEQKIDLYKILANLNGSNDKRTIMRQAPRKLRNILEHHYPNGKTINE